MPAALLFGDPFIYLVDADGKPIVGGEVTIFEAGTSTPLDVFHDSDLGAAWTQPIVTNAAGKSDGPVFLSPTPSLKVVAVDSNNVAIDGFPIDDVTPYVLES